ncbi:MAG: aldehyde dehydrogenase family protein [Pseudanabaenaceae cyanobacterium]
MTYTALLQAQRDFFASGVTRSLAFRQEQLRVLAQALQAQEARALQVLQADLGKPPLEALGAELLLVAQEISWARRQLPRWVRSQRVPLTLTQWPGRAEVRPEPLGVSLILSPWNYPLQLALVRMVGAIAAGNCAIVKPSEWAPHTSQFLQDLCQTVFPPEYVRVVTGDKETAIALLAEKFDQIFFTGSTRVGRLVMQAAAVHLTPVTLELGGKSPAVVAPDADLEVAVRRIVWGKFLNAGQTCIAPDYVWVPRSLRTEFVERAIATLRQFYGEDPQQSPDYGRIVSADHWDRLHGLLDGVEVLWGGQGDRAQRYFAPTLVQVADWEAPVMQEEIFGPILPLLPYDDLAAVRRQLTQMAKPLALYFFGRDRRPWEQICQEVSFGGGCFNDTIAQVAGPHLPFGGVGESGMGRYHGYHSFAAFSHFKSLLHRPNRPDVRFRYPPYPRDLGWLKRWLQG